MAEAGDDREPAAAVGLGELLRVPPVRLLRWTADARRKRDLYRRRQRVRAAGIELQVQHVALPYPNPAPASAKEEPVLSMPRSCLALTVQAAWGPVRIMTSHLEFYNAPARYAQTVALRDWHRQCSALAAFPPKVLSGSPYQRKPHTFDTILCGDFNFEQDSPEHAAMIESGSGFDLLNSWNVLHPASPYPPTFRIFDRTYGPEPVGCDFFFISHSLKERIRNLMVNPFTQASDHQPVLLEVH